MVGAFLGLSRERSDARRFPAIHPLDSWSHYKSIVDINQVGDARALLRRGNDVNQMMKVIGEEGTHIDDFEIYLKSEMLDYVYLQQNTFDKVDGACDRDRQRLVFDKVNAIMKTKFKFKDKDQARRFFLELRQIFIDWNYMEMDSEGFSKTSAAIDAKVKECANA